MRVRDLRVDLPDFRPKPRVQQEKLGNIPKRVTGLDHVLFGVSGVDQYARLNRSGAAAAERRQCGLWCVVGRRRLAELRPRRDQAASGQESENGGGKHGEPGKANGWQVRVEHGSKLPEAR